MKKLFVFGFMFLLMVSFALAAPPQTEATFETGGIIVSPDIVDVIENQNFTIHFGVFDQSSGVIFDNSIVTCSYGLFKTDPYYVVGSGVIPAEGDGYTLTTSINDTGNFGMGVKCYGDIPKGTTPETYEEKGAYDLYQFTVSKETKFGLWKPVEDWTFPIVYLVITFLVILFAIAYEASIVGVLGSLMLIFSYFIVGATSPILFTPLLIIGFLLAFKFGTQ